MSKQRTATGACLLVLAASGCYLRFEPLPPRPLDVAIIMSNVESMRATQGRVADCYAYQNRLAERAYGTRKGLFAFNGATSFTGLIGGAVATFVHGGAANTTGGGFALAAGLRGAEKNMFDADPENTQKTATAAGTAWEQVTAASTTWEVAARKANALGVLVFPTTPDSIAQRIRREEAVARSEWLVADVALSTALNLCRAR